jgi:1-acyl-sn-glycerol-3-phosphate acyltransferase
MLAAVGARVTYHGLQHAQARSPVIFISNHQSMVDVWAILCVIPPATRFAAKQELFRIPVFGWLLRASGCVPINRASRAEAIRSLAAAGARIRAGCSVVLFPEGTRSRDGKLQPFKKGAFHLALQAAVPVVPLAITGSFAVMPPRTLRVRPGPVDVWIEPPIDVAPYQPADHERLLADVHRVIRRRFEAAASAPRTSAVGVGAP